jgi:hypothetical protein
LTELTRKNPWKWGEEQQTAFEKLKSALQTTQVLAIPDKTGTTWPCKSLKLINQRRLL